MTAAMAQPARRNSREKCPADEASDWPGLRVSARIARKAIIDTKRRKTVQKQSVPARGGAGLQVGRGGMTKECGGRIGAGVGMRRFDARRGIRVGREAEIE
jgi:hypothetical protein